VRHYRTGLLPRVWRASTRRCLPYAVGHVWQGCPGPVSGPWYAPPRSPWPAPFPPPSPPVPWGNLCSKASSVLWSGPTPCTRASRSYPVGAPCGPGSTARPDAGPPGFRTPCFHACQRSPTPPGSSTPRQSGIHERAFRVFGARRHPGL